MPHGLGSRLFLAVFYALPSDQGLGRRRGPVGIVAASAGDVLWQVRHVYCVSRTRYTLGLLGARGVTSGTPPACYKGRLPIIQALGPNACGPSAQWRQQPCDSMFSRFADPLPLERRNDVVSSVSGGGVSEDGSLQAARARSFQPTERFSSWHIEQTFSRNCVFRSRLAHLMQYPGPSDSAELRIG